MNDIEKRQDKQEKDMNTLNTSLKNDYAKTDMLNDYAKTDMLNDYAKTDMLNDYAKTDMLNDYAKTDMLNDYAKTDVLNNYVKTDTLKEHNYATLDELDIELNKLVKDLDYEGKMNTLEQNYINNNKLQVEAITANTNLIHGKINSLSDMNKHDKKNYENNYSILKNNQKRQQEEIIQNKDLISKYHFVDKVFDGIEKDTPIPPSPDEVYRPSLLSPPPLSSSIHDFYKSHNLQKRQLEPSFESLPILNKEVNHLELPNPN